MQSRVLSRMGPPFESSEGADSMLCRRTMDKSALHEPASPREHNDQPNRRQEARGKRQPMRWKSAETFPGRPPGRQPCRMCCSRPDAQHQSRKRGVSPNTISPLDCGCAPRQARRILVHPPITQFPCKTPPRQDEVKCGCMCRQGVVGRWSAEGGRCWCWLWIISYIDVAFKHWATDSLQCRKQTS